VDLRVNAIPAWALVHTVLVEAFLGRTGTGPKYATPVEHRCLISDTAKLIRTADNREITASVSLYLTPGTRIPLESRIDVRGRLTTVVDVRVREAPGLPTPDHVQVLCE
jgi:hypothetical protein